MWNSRSATNWSSILDSSHALRKFLHPKQRNKAAIKSVPSEEHGEWPLNSDWKLARNPLHHAEVSAKKSIVSLPKKAERIIWAKPSMVELTKAAVRTERAKASAIKFHEKLQAKKTQPEKTDQPVKPQRAPLWQPKTSRSQLVQKNPSPEGRERPRRIRKSTKKAAKASANNNVSNASKPAVSAKKNQSLVRKTRKPKAVARWINRRPSNILVVDAKTDPGRSRPNTGGAEQPMDSVGGQAVPRRSKKSYGVPLCSRPTKILGMGYPYSRHIQMRQQQLCQQPEYRDQYVRMLHRQQRQLEQYYGQPCADSVAPDNQQQQILYMAPAHQKIYAVPAESPLKGLKKGKRMCGNFYFD